MGSTEGNPGAALWDLRWRSGTDLDRRLIRQWRIGGVRAMAWWSGEPEPMLAVSTTERSGSRQERYRLLVGDAETGRFRELPSSAFVSNLAFAATTSGPLLVSSESD